MTRWSWRRWGGGRGGRDFDLVELEEVGGWGGGRGQVVGGTY